VGSRVCQQLASQGAIVTSLSKSGKPPPWALLQQQEQQQDDWTTKVTWKSIDLVSATDDQVDACLGNPTAVISCVGTIGTDPDKLLQGNGMANVKAFESAQRSGTVQSIAYVSVSSEVAACQDTWLPEFFTGYFRGKDMAEAAARAVGKDVTLVRPTFIYGGDSFGLLPPRVNSAYGSFIDQLLSFSLIQKLADISPGLIKVALRPPVSVDAVAGACVNAVLQPQQQQEDVEGSGSTTVRVLDSAAEINQASGQPPARGVQDAIEWTLETTGKIVEWVQTKAKQMELDSAKK
jgi:nucleoside-diphosphate-sugar epimerase